MVGPFSLRIVLAGLLLVVASRAPMAQEAAATTGCKPLPDTVQVDRAWGGTRIRFDAVESKVAIYVGYYDEDRWLTVGRVDKCTGQVSKVRVPSQFTGWDSHNYISLALDPQERLHLAGNMHASPLVYARMSAPDDLQSLGKLQSVDSGDESSTTYPTFFKFPDGSLGFSFRSGGSAAGKEVVKRFNGQRWDRWLDSPLFAPASGGKSVSAYSTGFVKGPDGYMHTAWVWRYRLAVESNASVNYARSKDLRRWEDSNGRQIALPITPDNAEVVDPVLQEQGLFNNVQIGFDQVKRPVISYIRFDDRGATQLFHARREASGWKRYASTQWSYRWDPRGRGTIPAEITFSGVDWRDGKLLERVRHPDHGNATLQYHENSLRVTATLKDYQWDTATRVKRAPVGPATMGYRPVNDPEAAFSPDYAISWLNMPADNRDRPRPCQPAVADCRYSYPLLLHKVTRQR